MRMRTGGHPPLTGGSERASPVQQTERPAPHPTLLASVRVGCMVRAWYGGGEVKETPVRMQWKYQPTITDK